MPVTILNKITANAPIAAIALVLGLATAACVPAPEQPPAPTPAPVANTPATPAAAPPAAAPPAAQAIVPVENWQSAPLSAGDWRYLAEPDETLAIFGTAAADADTRLVLACRKDERQIAIGFPGASTGTVSLRIRTETAQRSLPAQKDDTHVPLIVAQLNPADQLLDAMAFSKGRIAFDATGYETLIVPAYPEITRVIEDCRQ